MFTPKQIRAAAIAALAGLVFAGVTGCASTAWRQAREADSADGYRAFLRNHPDHPNAELARELLAEKEFEAAAAQHSVLAYKRFLDEFPDSAKADQARARLEAMRFNAAKEADTAQAWRLFLRDHPDGAHRDEAERLLAEAEFREVGPAAELTELARLVRERPDDPRRAELQTRLDDESFAAAKEKGAFALYRYLREFPAGAHRTAAQAELFRLRIRGLLVSGEVEQAKAELSRSPLASQLPELAARVKEAEARRRQLSANDPLVRRAQVGHYLRSVEDLAKALHAPDPLDRWQAAEELGQHVTLAAIDPLLDAFRTARNPLIRQQAFDSLRSVLTALPQDVSDYEIATRVEVLRGSASSPETWVVLAALLDVAGRIEDAAIEYQRAWDRNLPDPVILRRWVDIRLERRQTFSAAVAARQLALWAERVATEAQLPETADPNVRLPVADVRELCAAATNARFAKKVIDGALTPDAEFQEDLRQFALRAQDAVRMAEARLRDAELMLRTQDPNARTCDDRRVSERIEAAVADRAAALRALTKRGGAAAPWVLATAREVDPSPEVRALAASLAQGRPVTP